MGERESLIASRDWLPQVWRVGRKVGRTIYAQLGEESSDDDPLIGVMDTGVLASDAVACHNDLHNAPDWSPWQPGRTRTLIQALDAHFAWLELNAFGLDALGKSPRETAEAGRRLLDELTANLGLGMLR